MAYILRDKNGVMRARLENSFAKSLMDEAPGFFRDATFKNRGTVRVFELAEDMKLGSNTPMNVFLWKGEILVPE